MGLLGNIFQGILGGIGASSDRKANKEDIKLQGKESRRTLQFADDLEYFRNMQQRHERSRALDTNYKQFSTVGRFAPYFKPGTGLDAMPTKPDAEEDD